MKKLTCLILAFLSSSFLFATSPIKGLLERIDIDASKKIIIEEVESDIDFFELDSKNNKPVVRGNNYISIATGVNWYLKYYVGVHLSWNNPKAKLPKTLPLVYSKERHETKMKMRYSFNYCTYSYTMAFWDWKRWEQEIDWMALHGINMPLSIVGMGTVWRNVLIKLGYTKKEVNDFVAGPAFQAWWLMNNLEGWGGPNPDSWYEQQERLQKKIVKRMREFGIEPIFPGYSGMLPNNAKDKLNLDVADPGKWCDYNRPSFLQPTDKNFQRIANIYYKEITRLYGNTKYYSMDPFHEGGNTKGVDLSAAGKAIWKAMKNINPKAVWVIQSWGGNPHDEMIKNLPAGDLVVLDLFSESRPQWGHPDWPKVRPQGFRQHNWLFCMLLNFGGNVGLHGKMAHLIDDFYKAKEGKYGNLLKGIGLTPEGIENNPVMYELLCELPWRNERFSKDEWLIAYVNARYGKSNSSILEGWLELSNTIYACPDKSWQQGTHESIFCARPSLNTYQVSSWAGMVDYYNPMDIIKTAGKFIAVADDFRGNNNFEYDLVDIVRQAVAEKGRLIYPIIVQAYKAGDKALFKASSERFLQLILLQDRLLATRNEFKVGKWIKNARDMGNTAEEKDLFEWNARTQITTWGNRKAAEGGGLHDYAHKEWNGILKDYYYKRWKLFFDELNSRLNGSFAKDIDFYALEKAWTQEKNSYNYIDEGDVIEVAKDVYREIRK